jgi:hypothetical protein
MISSLTCKVFFVGTALYLLSINICRRSLISIVWQALSVHQPVHLWQCFWKALNGPVLPRTPCEKGLSYDQWNTWSAERLLTVWQQWEILKAMAHHLENQFRISLLVALGRHCSFGGIIEIVDYFFYFIVLLRSPSVIFCFLVLITKDLLCLNVVQVIAIGPTLHANWVTPTQVRI